MIELFTVFYYNFQLDIVYMSLWNPQEAMQALDAEVEPVLRRFFSFLAFFSLYFNFYLTD